MGELINEFRQEDEAQRQRERRAREAYERRQNRFICYRIFVSFFRQQGVAVQPRLNRRSGVEGVALEYREADSHDLGPMDNRCEDCGALHFRC